MSVAMVLLITLGLLFALAFFTRRRFGVLGLALAAGSILSELWSRDLTPYVRETGIQLLSPPLESVVAAAIVLLPAVVLLFSGPSYKKMSRRLIGAGAFSLLALALLLPILGNALILQDQGRMVYDLVVMYRPWIITGGLVFALFDILTAKSKGDDKEKH